MKRIAIILMRGLAVLVPVGLGVLAIIVSGSLFEAPEASEKAVRAMPVRVLTLEPVDVLPRVKGYGKVTPARAWRAVARIDGEIIETAENLANGRLAEKGTVLARIDDTDLQLAIAQTDAQLAALDVKDETLNASLAISRSDLELSEAELERQKALQDRGVATQARLEQAQRAVVAARAKMTEIENQLVLNGAERKVLRAQRAISERNLDFTSITAPYDIIIGEVNAELGQVVTRGATLFTAEGTDAAEVSAQFAIGRAGPVVRALEDGQDITDLGATVRLPVPGRVVEWPASVARIGETVDARTQSPNIVVRVDRPLDLAEPGVRPPLRRNMFVEVELHAPLRKTIAVPAEAVQAGSALVVGAGNRLETRAVRVSHVMDGIAIVGEGLAPGDRLVVSDPTIAIPGMAVLPVEDEALKADIAAAAIGREPGE
ncbi:MAG: HlyD family efflux transporter periplasmic adaptor subunit [Zhengella sp.]|uniref:efflux RND transporter periplasmic adaptor subunit n=1 Tax=Zhengella sp. TaxID=2282762 RepID=UPI001E14E39F|nr:HlyD family efflux transporter periplasmic adaptor subunit [Notoacmeibacter sp.]